MNNLVSIIVPVYNVEDYLKECVDSLISQTYSNLEIILVDDGSTDNSGAICDEYAKKDNRIKVIHKENGGLSAARNSGTEIAGGDYLYYVDSDDFILSKTIFELVEILEKESCDFVFFGADSFADNGDSVSQNYHRKNTYPVADGKTVFEALQKNNEFHSAVPLMIFKRNFLENNNLTFEESVLFEDMLFTFQVYMLAEKVSFKNKNYYQRRYRNGSIVTSSVSAKKFESLKAIVELLVAFSKENNLINSDYVKKYIVRNSFNAINTYSKLTDDEKEQCNTLYNDLKTFLKDNNCFGDEALESRCRSKFLWLFSAGKQRVFGKIK